MSDELLDACKERDFERILELIQQGANVHIKAILAGKIL
jgi:hypothetical protein